MSSLPPTATDHSAKFREILKACALEYNPAGGSAPVVKWYAEGEAAERLIAIARKHGVRIEADQEESLLLALKSVKVNTEIPTEIYLAMARIYAYLLQDEAKG